MTEDNKESKPLHTVTSAHIALGAGLISSTLFLVAASLVTVGCFIASTQSIGAIEEGSADEIRVMFWGSISLITVIVFYYCGIVGMKKVLRGYRESDQLTKTLEGQ